MNRIITLTILSAICMAFGQQVAVMDSRRSRANHAVEQEIQRLHQDYGHAQLTNDIAMLERIWADDHTFTSTFGVVQTEAERLADARSGARRIESIDLDDVKVRLYGDTAVVTSRAAIKMRLLDQELTVQARGIDVYVKRNGRWQVVAAQATRIAQP